MDTDYILVDKDSWELADDNLWYAHIPTKFDCSDADDTIMELADDDDYIEQHARVFESLQNGKTGNNEVIIACSVKPDCDIKVVVKTLDEAGGKIMYDSEGNPEYIPDTPDLSSIMTALPVTEETESQD